MLRRIVLYIKELASVVKFYHKNRHSYYWSQDYYILAQIEDSVEWFLKSAEDHILLTEHQVRELKELKLRLNMRINDKYLDRIPNDRGADDMFETAEDGSIRFNITPERSRLYDRIRHLENYNVERIFQLLKKWLMRLWI